MSTVELIETKVMAENGVEYIQYQPVLKPDCCGQGEITFASWQVEANKPETHADAKRKALYNAWTVIGEFMDAAGVAAESVRI